MTVSAAAVRAGGRLRKSVEQHGDLLHNSASLVASSMLTSGLGFVYWWVAARLFSADAVGSAAAAVSAMSLVGTIGMFGMGTLLLAELPRMTGRRSNLISTCMMISAAVSAVGGVAYVLGADALGTGLRAALGSTLTCVLLLAGIPVNAAMLVLDEGLVGLWKGRLQLVRNAYFAAGKLVLLLGLVLLPAAANGTGILATWVVAIPVSTVLLAMTSRSRPSAAALKPARSLMRGLGRHAVDHNLLNLALFVPRQTLPLVVTAVLSTRATAAFYTAWMILTVLAMVPGHMATTLFTVTSAAPSARRAKIRMALVVSLGVGVPASLVIAVFARPIMALFGESYATAASGALRILALTFAATAVRQLYVAVARLGGRARRASMYAVVAGIAELVAAWYGAGHGGLTALAWWLGAVMAVEGVLMAPAVLRAAYGTPSRKA